MREIDTGYKLSVEVLLNLNHDRYKTYFTQFMVLHLGIFTAMNSDYLLKLIPLFALIGIVLSIIWYMVLRKINADIKQLWHLIEQHEKKLKEQSIKICESRSPLYGAAKWMLCVPVLFAIVHVTIAIYACNF